MSAPLPTAYPRRHRSAATVLLVPMLVASWFPAAVSAAPAPADPAGTLREIRTVHTSEFGVPHPSGITYDPGEDVLLVAGPDEDRTRLISIDRAEELVTSSTLPAGASFEDGELFALDATAREIVVRDPGTRAGVDRRISIDHLPEPQLAGFAQNPVDGLFYVGAPDSGRIYALDATGEVQVVHDFTATDVRDLQDLVFAPSSDTTDDPATVNLFIADAGDETALGGVTEVSLAAVQAAAVTTTAVSLVQVIHTSAFDPASPDPAGVTYLPEHDRLLIVDSEVNEVTGAGHTTTNLWQLDRNGVVDHTGDTYEYTDEPTGLGYDADGARLFISSDDDRRIHILETGGDGRFGTSDDVRSSIDVGALGVTDAEDPEFDPGSGALFFLDGVSTQVYRIDPVNGVFGDADDQVSNFDVGQFGVTDAEALGSDPERGTLLVGDRRGETVYELTTSGELVQIIDVSAASELRQISGLTVAPTSTDPSQLSYWIVDRAVDNGSNPNENDGKLFEFARAVTESPPAVTITSPEDGANVVAGGTVVFAGSAVDVEDGDLTDTLLWTSDVDGVLGTGGSVTATPSQGTHRITAQVTDADSMVGRATITLHVVGENGPFTVERAVTAGADDAEESVTTGAVDLGSSDLELGADGATQQRVGMRFRDVDIPVGATVTAATIQFQVDQTDTNVTDLTIEGEAVGNAGGYLAATGDISSRPRTAAKVSWQPPAWTTVGERGPSQRTPDLTAIVQEIVDRPDWTAGNAVAFMVAGTGERTAEAADSGVGPPTLVLQYTTDDGGGTNTAPRVTAAGDATFLGSSAALTGTVEDDGLPSGSLTASWSVRSGPGMVTFADADAVTTTATFGTPGVYELELTVSDGELSGSDTAPLTVVDPSQPPAETADFAIIGDFGDGSANEAAVAGLVDGWSPEFVVTVGDNSYTAAGQDENVGRFYAEYIGNYRGAHGQGAALNRFFPALGDEDLEALGGLEAYLDYYTLPGGGIHAPAASGNERYYDVVRGPVHFFVLNSNGGEPDGREVGSIQYSWLESGLAASDAPWQVVIVHEPPFSSAGSKALIQWPYADWGADAVLSGHRHHYERLELDGIPYIVNGLGGAPITGTPISFLPESRFFYDDSHGAVRATACASGVTFTFDSVADGVVDTHTIGVPCGTIPPPGAPTDLTATARVGAVDLGWTDTSDDETGFEIERSTDGVAGTFATIGSVAAGVTAYEDTDVVADVEHCYRVRATGGGEPSSYTEVVCATPAAANQAPVAVDDTATTSQGVAVTVDVLANDTEPDGEPLQVTTLTTPAFGSAVANADGTVEYTPDPDYVGSDAFGYGVCDPGGRCDSATVSVTVTGVDHLPVAVDDAVTVVEDGGPATGDVVANDTGLEDDGIVVTVVTDVASGVLELAVDGTFGYTPAADFAGTDGFEYSVCDVDGDCDTALVTITVTPVDDPPTAVDDTAEAAAGTAVTIPVTDNDTDPDDDLDLTSVAVVTDPGSGQAVANTDGTVEYTSAPDFEGTDQFVYEVCDTGGRCDTATVTVTVTELRLVQRAVSESTVQGSIVSGDLSATSGSDDVYEVLAERHSGGNPRARTSALEHRWVFEVTAAADVSFGVEAYRPANAEGDDFVFAFSTDGGASWADLVTVDGAVDDDQAQVVSLPPGTSGTVIIRVTDTDPSTPGNGTTDTVHVDDLWIISAGSADLRPVATVTVVDDVAGEPADDGVFRITRSDAAGTLTVGYTLAGDATAGLDYLAPSGTVTLVEGQTFADVVIAPLDDDLDEPPETVVLTLEPGDDHLVGVPATASLTLTDDDAVGPTTVLASGEQGAEGNQSGDFTATFGSDGIYETITEVIDPRGRRSSLEHRWSFALGSGGSATFAVEAHRSVGVDEFSWSYSTDGGTSWSSMNLVTTSTVDDDTVQSFDFPAAVGGTLWVRVEDTNSASQEATLDSLLVDQLRVELG